MGLKETFCNLGGMKLINLRFKKIIRTIAFFGSKANELIINKDL